MKAVLPLTDILCILEVFVVYGKVSHIDTHALSKVMDHVHVESIRDVDVDARVNVLICVHLGVTIGEPRGGKCDRARGNVR